IKEGVELTLCDLADDIFEALPEKIFLSTKTHEEIFKILSKYAEEIFLAQKESLTDEKVC
ncbi:MAG: hypothetical protein U9R03_04210, partial [Candidatus Aerophobetes bacterium]|nr:hypothetical protein [Candidatus Aerophobetes bacterium]